jgi:Heterokaryon incompatibility protein (HET)
MENRGQQLRYSRLSVVPHEIRLITIDPTGADATEDSMIMCNLEHQILDSAPDYVALSYHWGDAEDTLPILVNGCTIQATRSLVGALKALRMASRFRVWADALCINQKDDEERALQVLRMSSIYLAASVVSIWLGPSQDGSDAVMKVMVAAQDGATFTFKADDTIYELVSWRPAQDGASLKSGADDVDDVFVSWSLKTSRDGFIDVEHPVEASMLRYIRALLARPYWERLWILQEVSLGIRVEVLCGGYVVDWNTFAGVLTTARIALPDCFSRLESIMSLRQNVSNNQPLLFFTALCDTHSSKATVPRDKMYGLLGITVDGPRLFPAPSYSQHHSIIFRNLAYAQVTSQQSLDFILLKGNKPVTSSTRNLPSWVPNWLELHPASYEWRIAQYIRDKFSGTALTDQRERWRASGYSKVNPASVVVNGASLRVRGQFVNAIWQVGSVYGDKDPHTAYSLATSERTPATLPFQKAPSYKHCEI